ncbi:MAG: hydroxyacid dehydrogenase [Micromonosporaceae bacterium]
MKVVLAMQPGLYPRLFDAHARQRLRTVADVDDTVLHDLSTPYAHRRLADADVLLTGWGCPPLTADVLAHAPRLRAVVHAAGSVKHHITDAVWHRGIEVSSAAAANAVPVAEFTVAVVLLANKRVLPIAANYRRTRTARDWDAVHPSMGNYRKRVGVVGASRIGRRVLELLRPYDLELVLSDPYLDPAEAQRLGVPLLALDELVATSDVVTLHAPDLPETFHLMNADRLGLMRPGATLVNTARGALVDTDALTRAVLDGRVHAVLDVTTPEVLPVDSPLYDHDNVLLTPHIAGSLGTELVRMGQLAIDEIERLANAEPLAHPVLKDQLGHTA